ncbi:hypothetical protein BSYN_11040 [Bacteroides sedimenti]|uniref:Uncharacterized protein n=1 Tax=Bacteroides sedimenti TaxID=2136147 RepID=A0ABN6Z3Y3_9BACE
MTGIYFIRSEVYKSFDGIIAVGYNVTGSVVALCISCYRQEQYKHESGKQFYDLIFGIVTI